MPGEGFGTPNLLYHGDPNAPIGLVQFEEQIEALVNEVME